jgi:hypothetical protein
MVAVVATFDLASTTLGTCSLMGLPQNTTPVTGLDNKGNSYVEDASAFDCMLPGIIDGSRVVILSAILGTALAIGDTITVTFPFDGVTPFTRAVEGMEYQGVKKTGGAPIARLDQVDPGNSLLLDDGGGPTSISSAGVNTSTSPSTADELILYAFGGNGPTETTFGLGAGPTNLFGTGTNAPSCPPTDISLQMADQFVTTVGTYSATGSYTKFSIFDQNADTVCDLADTPFLRVGLVTSATYRAAPDRLVFPGITPTSSAAGACSTAIKVQSNNDAGTATKATGIIKVDLTSTSPTLKFYSDATTCLNQITSVTIPAGATASANIYVKDTKAGSYTLTATQSFAAPSAAGVETVSAGTKLWSISAATATQYVMQLPGQSWTPGVTPGVSGTISPILVGTQYNVSIRGADPYFNFPTFAATNTMTFTGLNASVIDGAATFVPATGGMLTFTGTVGSSFLVTPRVAQSNAAITAAGTAPAKTGTTLQFNVTNPTDTTGTGITSNSPGQVNTAPGTFAATLTNGTGGSITQVVITRPNTDWTWSPTATDHTLSGTGCGSATVTVGGSTVTFTMAAGAFPYNSVTPQACTFTAKNTNGLYPNVAVTTNYNINVAWSGNQAGSANVPFSVQIGAAPAVLPLAVRRAASTNTELYWTNATTTAGVLVVRGTDTPVNGTSYTVGSVFGAGGSTVACVAASGATSCTDAFTASAQTYVFYNFLSGNRYASGVNVLVQAKPSSGFVAGREAITGLAEPSLRPSTASVTGYAVFPVNNGGLYFLQSGGVQQRQAVLLSASVQRRASLLNLLGTGYAALAGDQAGTVYKIDPAGGAVTSVSVGALPITASIGSASKSSDSLNVIHSSYGGDVLFVGTGGASGNIIRALNASLGTQWTKSIGTDAVTAESYFDYSTGLLFVPVNGGTGGIYVLNINSAFSGAGPTTAAPLANVSGSKLNTGFNYTSQCRKSGAYLICGTSTGKLQSFRMSDGGLVSTFNTGGGSIKNNVPTGNSVYYTTSTGRVGAVTLTAGIFGTTATWENALSDVSACVTVTSMNSIYVGSSGQILKLRMTDGFTSGSYGLSGASGPVSTISMDSYAGVFYVQTNNSTMWGVPVF